MFRSICIAGLCLPTVACNNWEDASTYAYSVFSEDGQGIAAVQMNYEQQNTGTYFRKKNYSTLVLMKENTDSTVPPAITEPQDGAVQDLFFMRDAEYLILGRATDAVELSDGSAEQDVWYDKIDMDGSITSLGGGTFLTMLSCDGGLSSSSVSPPNRIIPSPDGLILAKIESQTSCTNRTQQVTFLEAASLTIIDGPHTIPDVQQTMGIWPTMEQTWLDTNRFAVGFWGSGTTFDYYKSTIYNADGTQETETDVHIGCFYPPTASSEVSEQSKIEIDSTTGTITLVANNTGTSYGCAQ